HRSLATAQALGALPGLAVPNTLLFGQNAGQSFAVTALDVVGSIGIDPGTGKSEDDYYSFVGKAGDLMNIEVLSSSLNRTVNPMDSGVRLFASSGKLLAVNDDEFETHDSTLIDATLPADGVYYVEVDTFTPDGVIDSDVGTYELFLYSFATGPSLGAGDTIVA